MAYRVSGWRLWLRIGLAIIGVVLGVAAALAFGIVYKNINASIWSILSAAWAAITLILHIAVHKDEDMKIRHHSFKRTLIGGLIGLLAGLVAFFVYLAKGILDHETGVQIKGHYIVTVWAFMLFKWGLALLLHSKWYRDELRKALGDLQGGTEDSTRIIN